MKKVRNIGIILFLLTAALILLSDLTIDFSTRGLLYSSSASLPSRKAGLLLGTSKYLGNGKPNPFFYNRVLSTALLYKMGKIKIIIISGDNRVQSYNEPRDMKRQLVLLGIPEMVIFLDYAGFRTYDSVIRASKVFGQTDFIIISQKFHNQRALFIAQQKHISAIAFNAPDVYCLDGMKTKIRERFARVKVFIDLLAGTEPKFLGKAIRIE